MGVLQAATIEKTVVGVFPSLLISFAREITILDH